MAGREPCRSGTGAGCHSQVSVWCIATQVSEGMHCYSQVSMGLHCYSQVSVRVHCYSQGSVGV